MKGHLTQRLVNAQIGKVPKEPFRFCDCTSIWQGSGITEVWGDQKKDSHVARYTARTARTQPLFEGPFAINARL